MLDRARRDAEDFGNFFIGHADEVTQLHHFGFERMLCGEFFERVIDREELIVVACERQIRLPKIHAVLATAVAESALPAGVVDENASHRLGCGGKEMTAVFKLRVFVSDQPQPGFVNQGRGLERVSRRFIAHLARREPAQLLVNQRQQLTGAFTITGFAGV